MHISSKCSIAVHCLIFINEYGNQKKVTSELLALSAGCNPVTIRVILSSLKKAGIITVAPGRGGAKMKLPLKEVSLLQICQAVEPDALEKLMGVHSSPSPLCPVGRNISGVLEGTYQKVREDLSRSLKSVTLEDIVSDYHSALNKEE